MSTWIKVDKTQNGYTVDPDATPATADLENNHETTINVSTYTEPVEITPTQGKDGMAKVTVTLSNIPSGGLYATDMSTNTTDPIPCYITDGTNVWLYDVQMTRVITTYYWRFRLVDTSTYTLSYEESEDSYTLTVGGDEYVLNPLDVE